MLVKSNLEASVSRPEVCSRRVEEGDVEHRPVLQPQRVSHKTHGADGDELARSLSLATDGPHEAAVRVEYGDGRVLAPSHIDTTCRIHHQVWSANEGEPLGNIESVTEPEDLAGLHRFGVGDQLCGRFGCVERHGGEGHGTDGTKEAHQRIAVGIRLTVMTGTSNSSFSMKAASPSGPKASGMARRPRGMVPM